MTKAATVRLIEIADLLGVTKQRAHQIAEEKGFPTRSPKTPAAECGAGTRSRHGRSVGDARSPGASSSGSTNRQGPAERSGARSP
jgi:hypothetical protein